VPHGCLSASEQTAKRQVDLIAWGVIRKDDAVPHSILFLQDNASKTS
jgi:hypothetical protein